MNPSRMTSSVGVRRIGQVTVDACLVALAYYLAFALRFDEGIPPRYDDLLVDTILLVVVIKLALFAAFGLYSKLWRFVDQADFESIVKAVVVSSFVLIGLTFLFAPGDVDQPRGVIALDFLLTLALVGGARFLVRAIVERPLRGPLVQRASNEVLIVGAGNGGQQVAVELRRNPELSAAVIGFVDDDPRKQGMVVGGYRVHGRVDDLPRVLDDTKPDEVVIAIPSAPGMLRQKVVTACRERNIPVRTLPTTFELLSRGTNLLRQVREVQVEDVLGREPVRVEVDRVGAYLSGEVVLVTGAGGSIGSELCRQIAEFSPAELIMLDRDETGLQTTQISLTGRGLLTGKDTVLADIRDADTLRAIFLDRKPEVVFHAAALKHVSLLEQYPEEAWKTNVLGTLNVLRAAEAAGVSNFVNISTDKAADPKSVLGYSKRIAERLTADMARRADGAYISVRFGNVLGSRGSVLHTFTAQIRAGGPVTVTHPDITRYFMTVEEAVQLVIQAGAIGEDGEVMILDMGQPVKIVDVARQLIAMSGKSVEIVYTGLREGEKLHEELFGAAESDERSKHPLVSHAPVSPLSLEIVQTYDLHATHLGLLQSFEDWVRLPDSESVFSD